MLILRKTLKVSPKEFYKKHLTIINAFMPVPLAGRELDVLAAFMYYGNFKAQTRQKICEELGISSAGLGNYMASLKKKGYIRKDEHDNYVITPVVIPNDEYQMYEFTLKV